MLAALPTAFLADVRARLGQAFLADDPATLATYGRDWTRVIEPRASAVAFPRTTAEVAALLALCSAHRVSVVPSGGRTGYSGGAVAAHGELVLSLARMNRMDPVDELGLTVRVDAGAVTEAVHEHVKPLGLTWPVDFASKGSSTVGGNIATNAGGVKVIRYGLTRQWVLGLTVVLASGEVLSLNGALEKNNTGLDLRQLFIGSEGTLGVVTEAVLKLARLPGDPHVILFALDDLAGVLELFTAARRGPFVVSAFEFFTTACLMRLLRHRALRPPFTESASHYVLLEVEGDASELETWMAGVFERGLVRDGVLATSATQARELWTLREGISESLAATGLPHKNDIALPIQNLAPFCGALEALIARDYPGFEICNFGHIGDGNLHLNIMKPDAMDKAEFLKKTKAVDQHVFSLVQKHKGSVSAEHGIGLLKKEALPYSRSAAELALMRQVKLALDPLGILNPGKIFDA